MAKVDPEELAQAEQALERMTLEMGAAILHLEAAHDPLLPPEDAREHRETGELHAAFARGYAEQVRPEALAIAIGLDELKNPNADGQ